MRYKKPMTIGGLPSSVTDIFDPSNHSPRFYVKREINQQNAFYSIFLVADDTVSFFRKNRNMGHLSSDRTPPFLQLLHLRVNWKGIQK